MAGMFYSLEEAAEKLNKTEEELKQIVKEGKLREFRDGPNLLFKVEEVEALLPESGTAEQEVIQEMDADELLADTTVPLNEEPKTAESEELDLAMPDLEDAEFEIPETEKAEVEEPEKEIPELEDLEIGELEDTKPSKNESEEDVDEFLLAADTNAPVLPNSDLTNADTALTGQGTSMLGQTDRDYDVTDDTMAETVASLGASSEAPLEEIEEDVNLDSFGSGSGLLDLSLQADDTSLGGILDEIYTTEGEGAAELDEPEDIVSDSGGIAPLPEDQPIAEEDIPAPQSAPDMQALPAAPLMELAPDRQSNILGKLLFLPMLVVLYTIIVVVAGLKGVVPSILAPIQDFLWYFIAVGMVAAVLVAGMSFMLSGNSDTSAKKAKKEKKPKKEKVKKEKKPKKEKPPKEKKPKKEKKKKEKKKKK